MATRKKARLENSSDYRIPFVILSVDTLLKLQERIIRLEQRVAELPSEDRVTDLAFAAFGDYIPVIEGEKLHIYAIDETDRVEVYMDIKEENKKIVTP